MAVSKSMIKNPKVIVGIVIAIILIVVLYKNWYKIRRFFNPATTNPSPEAEAGGEISEANKSKMEDKASAIYSDIYSTPFTGHTYSLYTNAADLYDDHLEYLAQYYQDWLADGNKLYDDLDSEWFMSATSQNALLNRLKELGLN